VTLSTSAPASPTSRPPATEPARGPHRGDGRAALGFLAPSASGFLLFTLIPLVGSLAISFFAWPVIGRRKFVGLENFAELLSDPIFHRIMLNTLVFVVLYVPLNIVVSLGLALWISPRIRGRGIYRLLFFIPTVTPMIANALVWRLLYQPGGVIDRAFQDVLGMPAPNFLGDNRWAMAAVILMSVWQGFGYNMLVFSAGLDAIPQSLQEAASIDGAGPLRRFFSITLPMLSPSMFFAMIMTLITSFQVFVQPYVLTGGGPGITTETMVLNLYRQGFQQFDLGTASTIGWFLFMIIMLVTALQFLGQKRWVHYDD
jgi:multiple sugar transport system permease protein